MAEGFRVNPEALRAGGVTLASVGVRLGEGLEQFDAAIASFGQPWGGDYIGMLIGEAYQAAVDYAMGNFFAAADEIISAGDDVVGMADSYVSTDESANTTFTGLM
ncbi:hypothetical protein SAMN05421812_101285 [Asanoa hainanensis]|uniref:Excreted virulence factor EspC, type VII ESX diderm n=1 Tax=Asanoa hainanensis TaxID=560556 RepID=A0A239GCB7_9ACTN|nr:hypothetical protein [Asanoa hainanensis]SNS65694.1 hypothetical protein SAMN05421812_101285 [Asanoa hainanensis]